MPTRRVFAVALTLLAAACSTPAFATGSLVEVEIVDRGRNEVPPVHRPRGTHWVAGQPLRGAEAQPLGGRVLVVLSVDGVNAISGETAAASQTGYVLAPCQSAEITGWRKSMTEAAAFYFTALPDSYAARTGRPDNAGVIGVAVFRERVVAYEPRPQHHVAPAAPMQKEAGIRDAQRTAFIRRHAPPRLRAALPRRQINAVRWTEPPGRRWQWAV